MCMCTEAKSCVLHVMNYCGELLALKTRAVDHPVLGKVPRVVTTKREFEYLDIVVELAQVPPEQIAGNIHGRALWLPRLTLIVDNANPTAAQFWTWLDMVGPISEALLRVQAACDRQTPWTTEEIKEAMADWERWRKEQQQTVGGALASLLGGNDHPDLDEA